MVQQRSPEGRSQIENCESQGPENTTNNTGGNVATQNRPQRHATAKPMVKAMRHFNAKASGCGKWAHSFREPCPCPLTRPTSTSFRRASSLLVLHKLLLFSRPAGRLGACVHCYSLLQPSRPHCPSGVCLTLYRGGMCITLWLLHVDSPKAALQVDSNLSRSQTKARLTPRRR